MILIDDDAGSIKTVEYVFKVLAATYGAAWDRSLGTAPIADVMTVWANAMDGFVQSKRSRQSIVWALNNLPDSVPNARVFLSLCRNAPRIEPVALPAPAPSDPARVAAMLAPLRQAVAPTHGMKDWAHRLQARFKAGDKLNMNQVRCACLALGVEAL
jgi:hypothetical protein